MSTHNGPTELNHLLPTSHNLLVGPFWRYRYFRGKCGMKRFWKMNIKSCRRSSRGYAGSAVGMCQLRAGRKVE